MSKYKIRLYLKSVYSLMLFYIFIFDQFWLKRSVKFDVLTAKAQALCLFRLFALMQI